MTPSPRPSYETWLTLLVATVALAAGLALGPRTASAEELQPAQTHSGIAAEAEVPHQDDGATGPATDAAGKAAAPSAVASDDAAPQVAEPVIVTPAPEAPAEAEAAPAAPNPSETVTDSTAEAPVAPAQAEDDSTTDSSQPSPTDEDATAASATEEPTPITEAAAAESAAAEPELTAADATATATPPTISAPKLSGQVFVLEHGGGGTQVVYASKNKTANKTNIVTAAWAKKLGQQWKFVKGAVYKGVQYYYICRKGTKQVLTVKGGKAKSGANVFLYKKGKVAKTAAQLWRVRWIDEALAKCNIVSRLSSKYVLTIKGSKKKSGTNVILAKYKASASGQAFYLLNPKPKVSATEATLRSAYKAGVYTITAGFNKTFAVQATGSANKSTATLGSYSGSNAQRLILHDDGKGYYTISVFGTAKQLTVAGGSIIPGTDVYQTKATCADAQKWALRKAYDGSIMFVNKASGLALDFTTTTAKNGSNLRGYIATQANQQRYTITADTRPILASGYYEVKPCAATGQALTAADGKVTLSASNSGQAQKFQVVEVSKGVFRLRAAGTGGWLTAPTTAAASSPYYVSTAGVEATAQSGYNSWRVVFDANGYWALQNVATGSVLSLYKGATATGTRARAINSGNGTDGFAAQHFLFAACDLITTGVYNINSYYAGKSLAVKDAVSFSDGTSSILAGSNVELAASRTAYNPQKFRIIKKGNAYQIINYSSGYAVAPTGSDVKANVALMRLGTSDDQLWTPSIADGGYLVFVNVGTGMAFEAQADGIGANVVQHTPGSAVKGERWRIVGANGSVNYAGTGKQAATRVLVLGNSFTLNNRLDASLAGLMGDVEIVVHAIRSKNLDYLLSTASSSADGKSSTVRVLGKTGQQLLDVTGYGNDWDYILIQDLSNRPVDYTDAFLDSVANICAQAETIGATPVIYGTWSYEGSESNQGAVRRALDAKIAAWEQEQDGAGSGSGGDGGSTGSTPRPTVADLTPAEIASALVDMHDALQGAFEQALAANAHAILANVGAAFADPASCAGMLSDEEATGVGADVLAAFNAGEFAAFDARMYDTDAKHPSVIATRLAARIIYDAIMGIADAVSDLIG